MTSFLRLLDEQDKADALKVICAQIRSGIDQPRCFEVDTASLRAIPGAPFAYWVGESVRSIFRSFHPIGYKGRSARVGLQTSDDGRFIRCWWESNSLGWIPFAKGGSFSRFYSDIHLKVNWTEDGKLLRAFEDSVVRNPKFYFRPGLTWPSRTNGLSFRSMPKGCIFAHKGPAIFLSEDNQSSLLAHAAILNSAPFGLLVSVQLARTELAQSYEVGLIQQTPIPDIDSESESELAQHARSAWSLKRTLDTVEETSHAFLLPATLRSRLRDYRPQAIKTELARIQAEIDDIAFRLYGFNEKDRVATKAPSVCDASGAELEGDVELDTDQIDSLLSWAVGVAYGRFDWRLATGDREAPPELEPFDPLPHKSPGMLPDEVEPFLVHAGALVDDAGNALDLARAVEAVLSTVNSHIDVDVRRWLRRSFFPVHLKQYSKSKRKAPIYWPLGTPSGEYTLWLYYPALTNQTLYSALNDFVEPKLQEVEADLVTLRAKANERSKREDRTLEGLETLEQELMTLRASLLEIAPSYKPHHDDGVQITASPLAKLFQHKPWQKILEDTWKKLEEGEHDWAQLAMEYWPERVREKCKSDKSLAIAHGLEDLYDGDR